MNNIDIECAFIIPNMKVDNIPKPLEPMIIRQTETLPKVASIVVANFHRQIYGLREAYIALG